MENAFQAFSFRLLLGSTSSVISSSIPPGGSELCHIQRVVHKCVSSLIFESSCTLSVFLSRDRSSVTLGAWHLTARWTLHNCCSKKDKIHRLTECREVVGSHTSTPAHQHTHTLLSGLGGPSRKFMLLVVDDVKSFNTTPRAPARTYVHPHENKRNL